MSYDLYLYTWRHDNILNYIAKVITNNLKDGITIFVDIPEYNINGGTIPPSVVVTSQKPDIVIIDSKTTPSTVWLYELTAPFETNIDSSNSYKRDKYQSFN